MALLSSTGMPAMVHIKFDMSCYSVAQAEQLNAAQTCAKVSLPLAGSLLDCLYKLPRWQLP